MEEIINTIEIANYNIKSYIVDFKYEYKDSKNNLVCRPQRVIIFGNEENLNLLDKKNL